MGYRNYLYKIKKKDVNKIRNLTLEEIKSKYGNKEDYYVSIDDLLENYKCIFEFGKLYWDDTVERIHETGEKLFTNEEAQEHFSDYDPYLVGKDALKVAIKIYIDKIKKMYEHLKEQADNTETSEDKFKIYKEHVDYYQRWWKRDLVIDLNEDNICQSWLYEHSIFNLVYLYKTIDFEEYDLIFLGW